MFNEIYSSSNQWSLSTLNFKIGNIQVSNANGVIIEVAKYFEGMTFQIKIKSSNSKQMDSNIDDRIVEILSKSYSVTTSKQDLLVEADKIKVGELDIKFKDRENIAYYMEVEKSNKKTLWFDYIKILTQLKSDQGSYGIIMCPSNYAHSTGVWDLYTEAVTYKNHLKRVFGGEALDRVSIIGYTQYTFLNNKWKEFDTSVVKQIKNT